MTITGSVISDIKTSQIFIGDYMYERWAPQENMTHLAACKRMASYRVVMTESVTILEFDTGMKQVMNEHFR